MTLDCPFLALNCLGNLPEVQGKPASEDKAESGEAEAGAGGGGETAAPQRRAGGGGTTAGGAGQLHGRGDRLGPRHGPTGT